MYFTFFSQAIVEQFGEEIKDLAPSMVTHLLTAFETYASAGMFHVHYLIFLCDKREMKIRSMSYVSKDINIIDIVQFRDHFIYSVLVLMSPSPSPCISLILYFSLYLPLTVSISLSIFLSLSLSLSPSLSLSYSLYLSLSLSLSLSHSLSHSHSHSLSLPLSLPLSYIDEDDEAAFSASQCLDTIGGVLDAVQEHGETMAQLEILVIPLLERCTFMLALSGFAINIFHLC